MQRQMQSVDWKLTAEGARIGRAILCALCCLCVLYASSPAAGQKRRRDKQRHVDDQEKYIPTETYRGLTVFERAAYDKALKMHREGEYRVASELFRKFAMQFEDSVGMPYAMLMEARCMHKDRKRVTAIKKYTEILDYFPEAPEIAAPALYYRATARSENGDKLLGYKDQRALCENKGYVKHALGIPAMLSLGEYYYADKKRQAQAVTYWKALLKRNIHHHVRRDLLGKIRAWYVTNADFSGYLRFRLQGADPGDAATTSAQLVIMKEIASAVDRTNRELCYKAFKYFLARRSLFSAGKCMLDGGEGGKYSRGFYETALSFRQAVPADEFDSLAGQAVAAFSALTKGDGRYYTVGCGLAELIGGPAGDKINDEMVKQIGKEKDLAAYVGRACKVAAEAGGRTRDVLHKAIIVRMGNETDDAKFLAIAMGLDAKGKLKDSKAFRPMATQILARIGRQAKGKPRDDLYVRYMPSWSGYEAGYNLVGRIDDVKRRFMHLLGMLSHEHKWKEYVLALDGFEKNTPSTREGIETKNWIRKQRAWAYHHKVRRWEEAIKLYYAINEPPGTLWNIQDCFGRLKKWKDQLRVLGEIETSFPPEGPRAAQAIARVFQKQKMDKQAIAKCRYIMKQYRDEGVSSWAHQELEKYGKATGGGIIDPD